VELFSQSLIVFGLAIVELWLAIPAGFVLDLHPVAIAIASITGAALAAFIVALAGERLRAWLVRQCYGRFLLDWQQGRANRIWTKYGVVGLGLLAPLLTGAPVGALLGVTFGIPRRRLVLWMTIGIVLWGAGLTLAGVLGLIVFENITG
jgi:uncharacterized membrane protein